MRTPNIDHVAQHSLGGAKRCIVLNGDEKIAEQVGVEEYAHGRVAQARQGMFHLNRYCRILAQERAFVRKLNSMARQAAAERAAFAIRRFYDRCNEKKGKKGHPRYQKNCRSVEYKITGWKLDAIRRHLTITDGTGMGTFVLRGTRDLLGYALEAIKRVRLLRCADGYYAQFVVNAERHVTARPTGSAIGIDLGLTHFYTDSNGKEKENPRWLRKAERALRRVQKWVSWKKKTFVLRPLRSSGLRTWECHGCQGSTSCSQ